MKSESTVISFRIDKKIKESLEIECELENQSVNHILFGVTIRNAKKKHIENLREKKMCTYCDTMYKGNIPADELIKKGLIQLY